MTKLSHFRLRIGDEIKEHSNHVEWLIECQKPGDLSVIEQSEFVSDERKDYRTRWVLWEPEIAKES